MKPEAPGPDRAARTGPSNNQRRAWETERDKTEKEITALEREQAEIGTQLADEATYADKPKALALMERQRAVAQGLGEKLSRWEELCGLLG